MTARPIPSIEIVSLADLPSALPLCAEWNFEQWGREEDGDSLEQTVEGFRKIVRSGSGEHALVALCDGVPAGTILVVACDLDSHAHLTPWVAGVFTAPGFRGRSVATRMIEAAEDRARGDGHDAAYLYTRIPEFYARHGWVFHEILSGSRSALTVMRKPL